MTNQAIKWVSAQHSLTPDRPFYVYFAGIGLAFLMVEFSQLLQTPALNAFRGTTLGHLVLGSDFDARDLAAYAGGVFISAMVVHRRKSEPTP